MIAKSFAQSKGERKEALVTSMGDHAATHTTALLLVFQFFWRKSGRRLALTYVNRHLPWVNRHLPWGKRDAWAIRPIQCIKPKPDNLLAGCKQAQTRSRPHWFFVFVFVLCFLFFVFVFVFVFAFVFVS